VIAQSKKTITKTKEVWEHSQLIKPLNAPKCLMSQKCHIFFKKCSKQGFNLFSKFFWGLCGVWSWAGMLMGEVHVNVGFGLNENKECSNF